MENKFFFKPTKYKNDDNLAFSYFRSFITLYYCLLFSNNKSLVNIKKYYKRAYGNEKYFSLFKREFLDLPNPLIFTYFNTIPHIFFPYFEEMYLYFPIITFYGKDGFYKEGFLNYPGKIDGLYQKNVKISDKEIQITIPIDFLKKYKFPENYYILIKIGQKIVASNNVKILNDEIIIKNYKLKNKKDFKNTSENMKVNLNEIELAYVLVPITKEGISNIFKMDTLKKDSWIYFVVNKKEPYFQLFYSLYPKINMIELDIKIDLPWRCVRSKIIKDLNVLNLTVDIFYNNEIVNRKTNNVYMDLRDEEYKKFLYDDLFRCLKTDEELDKRRDICNFNIMIPYGEKTFVKNKGKKMINLLIFKNNTFINYSKYYYGYFLKKFEYKSFIYHYGFIPKKDKKIYYDMEIGFTDNEYVMEYVKKIDEVKGECQNIYKKGKLIIDV
jgi:hypothetical protein